MRSYLSSTSCSHEMNWRALNRSLTDLFSSPCKEGRRRVGVWGRGGGPTAQDGQTGGPPPLPPPPAARGPWGLRRPRAWRGACRRASTCLGTAGAGRWPPSLRCKSQKGLWGGLGWSGGPASCPPPRPVGSSPCAWAASPRGHTRPGRRHVFEKKKAAWDPLSPRHSEELRKALPG